MYIFLSTEILEGEKSKLKSCSVEEWLVFYVFKERGTNKRQQKKTALAD